jgi:hypothetical protein
LNHRDGFSVEGFRIVPLFVKISLFEMLYEIRREISNEVSRVRLAESFETLVNGEAGWPGNRTFIIVKTKSVLHVSPKGERKEKEACIVSIFMTCPSRKRSLSGF